MKKIYLQFGIGVCLLSMALGFCSCSPSEQPAEEPISSVQASEEKLTAEQISIQLFGFSDSILGVNHQLEFDQWSESDFVEETAEKTVRIEAFGKTVEGTYVKSRVKEGEFYPTRQYKASNGNAFELTPEGQVSWYFWNDAFADSAAGKVLTEQECIAIANAMVETLVDLKAYSVKAQYNENMRVYQVIYQKSVGDLLCADEATVTMDQYGRVHCFSSTQFGRMHDELKCPFEIKEVEKQIEKKLHEEYREIADRYDAIKYQMSHHLTQDAEGKAVLLSTVEVTFENYKNEYVVQQSELIQLVTTAVQ